MNEHELTLKILFGHIKNSGLILKFHDNENKDCFEDNLDEEELRKYKNGEMDEEEEFDIRGERCRETYKKCLIRFRMEMYVEGDLNTPDEHFEDYSFETAYDIIRRGISKYVDLDDLEHNYKERISSTVDIYGGNWYNFKPEKI